VLEARNIHKYYGKLHVLKGVDFSVKRSEIVSIVGASGAGKSTLIHILGTLEKPYKGEIRYDGDDITALRSTKQAAFRNKNIGFVFQFHHLLPEFTALENVCIPAFIGGTKRKVAEDQAKILISTLGLSDRMHHKPTQLSGGEQQRIAVARALINSPSIVFADEPSGNLDSANAKELHALFFSLRKEFGQAFVIVTHNEELAGMADRRLVMKDGLL